jgi:CheY-like chemotaxis protein
MFILASMRQADYRWSVTNPAKKILVVDDEEGIREALNDALAGEGYEVMLLVNGQEAWNRMNEGDYVPDLILLDLMMPIMGGAEFLSRILKVPAWSELPVLLFSATVPKQPVAGATGYLHKPVHLKQLLDVIEGYCGKPSA